ncbi:hypothetical protein CI610_01515 [invertebrate metagenome]|uniref:Peptidase C45 hydrolase domain-containing protein n=1 Tax=invertebrate metagenome TaxID=1711999 RepID=A0A2H9T8J3_9ZZZZ
MTTTPSIEMEQFTFSGTAEAMGYAHGETLRDRIQALVNVRFAAAEKYFREENAQVSIDALRATGRACWTLLEVWDPEGFIEHNAIASGANMDPADLYTATNYTDIRDALMLSGNCPDAEGCSAIMIPAGKTAEKGVLAAQTWDLNPEDIDYVVAIQNKPIKGPVRWNIQIVGSVSLMGMNSCGISVGTTNLKTWDSGIGLGYLSLIHRALRSNTPEEALHFIEKAPKSGSHSYWITNRNKGTRYEVTGFHYDKQLLDHQPMGWTNHCLTPEHQAMEYSTPSDSSLTRLTRLEQIFRQQNTQGADFSVESLKKVLANREDGTESINRYPEDNSYAATNACMIADNRNKQLHACRGPANRGKWYTLSFD